MGRERRCIKDFLSLPKKLYSADKNMESADTVRKILLGRHPLSGYFSLEAYVIYDRREPVGRFAITEYPEDDTAYIGFAYAVGPEYTRLYTGSCRDGRGDRDRSSDGY